MHPSNKISCDYVYGLAEAIRDSVCRVPQIVSVDNDNISVIDDEETKTFNSFKSLLSQSVIPYQDVIQNDEVMHYLVRSSHEKLTEIRNVNPDAAGLIVASSVEHARSIARLMKNSFNENASVVTYRENESTHIIQQFRDASTSWIISVGMISEGTNIPRLQVCCHLTNIKTEMHFRQILGRILRMTGSKNQEAVMYMPAEPKLLEYAYRVKQDVPFEADVVRFDKMKAREEDKSEVSGDVSFDKTTEETGKSKLPSIEFGDIFDNKEVINLDEPEVDSFEEHFLTTSYEKVVNIFGRFKQESIERSLSELR